MSNGNKSTSNTNPVDIATEELSRNVENTISEGEKIVDSFVDGFTDLFRGGSSKK